MENRKSPLRDLFYGVQFKNVTISGCFFSIKRHFLKTHGIPLILHEKEFTISPNYLKKLGPLRMTVPILIKNRFYEKPLGQKRSVRLMEAWLASFRSVKRQNVKLLLDI